MPAREICSTSASVLVPRPLALIECSMPSASAVSTSSSKTLGERVEPRPIAGPEPSGWLPISFSSTPGASVAWVTSTAIAMSGRTSKAAVRAPKRPISSCTAATAAKEPAELAALVGAAQALQRHVGAEAVVHRPGDEPVADDRQRLGGDHDRVADPDQLGRLVAVGGADVDVQALQLDHLLALVGLEQVDRLAADDAEHRPVLAAHLDPLADQDLRVPAADRGEPEEALLVDVGDDQPDLVDVADHRQQRRRVADAGDRGADAVAAQLGEGGGLPPDRGRRALVSGGSAGAQKFVEQWRRRGQGFAVCRNRTAGPSSGPPRPNATPRLRAAAGRGPRRSCGARRRSSPRSGRRRSRGETSAGIAVATGIRISSTIASPSRWRLIVWTWR